MVAKNTAKKATEELVEQPPQEQPKGTKRVIDLSKYEAFTTKSAKIRAMAADNYTRSEIAAALGIIYQHVRNVLTQPLKKPEPTSVAKSE